MKRGFMERNSALVTDDLLENRRQSLTGMFKAKGVHTAVIYGDVANADELHFFTNLGPYWGSAACLVGKDAAPFLVTGMTARVNFWVSMMSGVGFERIRSAGANVNTAVADQIAKICPAGSVIGIVGEYFPADMRGAIEKAGFPAVFLQNEALRIMRRPDEGRLATLRKGAGLLSAAFSESFQASVWSGATRQQAAADAEYACRRAGAMDCTFLTDSGDLVFEKAPDIPATGPYTLRALLQYLGEWIEISRSSVPGRNSLAFAERDAVLERLRPGLQPMILTSGGWRVTLCSNMRSDHAAWVPEREAELHEGQVLSVKVCHHEMKVLTEDLALLSEDGARLLTALAFERPAAATS